MTPLEEVIRQTAYKPGWCISFELDVRSAGIIIFSMPVQGPAPLTLDGNMSRIFFSVRVPDYEKISKDDAVKIVYKLIRECEEHEMKEWFLVDGGKVYDPHDAASNHGYRGLHNPDTIFNVNDGRSIEGGMNHETPISNDCLQCRPSRVASRPKSGLRRRLHL